MAEWKNICGKIPLELHEKVRREIEQTEGSTQKFIQQVIEEHFSRGETGMEKRTLAVQVSEELFGRLKAVIAKAGCKQKDFLTAIIGQAIAEEEKRLGLTGHQEREAPGEAEAGVQEAAGEAEALEAEEDRAAEGQETAAKAEAPKAAGAA